MEASSLPSDPQRRKPDDQTCCDGVVELSPTFTICHSDCSETVLSKSGGWEGDLQIGWKVF